MNQSSQINPSHPHRPLHNSINYEALFRNINAQRDELKLMLSGVKTSIHGAKSSINVLETKINNFEHDLDIRNYHIPTFQPPSSCRVDGPPPHFTSIQSNTLNANKTIDNKRPPNFEHRMKIYAEKLAILKKQRAQTAAPRYSNYSSPKRKSLFLIDQKVKPLELNHSPFKTHQELMHYHIDQSEKQNASLNASVKVCHKYAKQGNSVA